MSRAFPLGGLLTPCPSLAGNVTKFLSGEPWQEGLFHKEERLCPSLGWLPVYRLCSLAKLVCLPETQSVEFKTDPPKEGYERLHRDGVRDNQPTRPGMEGNLTPHIPNSFLFQNEGSLPFHFPSPRPE